MMGQMGPPTNASTGTSVSVKILLRKEGGPSILLGRHLPHSHRHVVQVLPLPLGADICPRIFLDELQVSLVLTDLERIHGTSLIGDKATYLLDHIPHELGVLGELPVAVAVPRLAHILGHLVTLVEAHSLCVAQSHGCGQGWARGWIESQLGHPRFPEARTAAL